MGEASEASHRHTARGHVALICQEWADMMRWETHFGGANCMLRGEVQSSASPTGTLGTQASSGRPEQVPKLLSQGAVLRDRTRARLRFLPCAPASMSPSEPLTTPRHTFSWENAHTGRHSASTWHLGPTVLALPSQTPAWSRTLRSHGLQGVGSRHQTVPFLSQP